MARLEQHRQHLAPQRERGNFLVELELATGGLVLVACVGGLERSAGGVVQVRAVRGRKQRPVAALHHPLHEQIGDPVRGVHVVGAATVVTRVLAQFQELLDVEVPSLEVAAHRALALAALVDGDRRVVDHLQEGDHALALAVGALDVAAQGPHRGPVVAQPAGVLGEQGVLLDRLVDAVEVVGHRAEVARRELGVARAAVEQRRRRAHEVEARKHLVELDRARLAVDLVERQAHRHAHEEGLGQLESASLVVQEVAVVERLQPEVVELHVALGPQRLAQAAQVVERELLVEQASLDAVLDQAREGFGIALGHLRLVHLLAKDLGAHRVQQ